MAKPKNQDAAKVADDEKEKTAAEAAEKAKTEAEAEAKAAAEEKARTEALKKAGSVELIALEPILHDGERIEPGEAFTVTRKQAAAHLKNKTAEKA